MTDVVSNLSISSLDFVWGLISSLDFVWGKISSLDFVLGKISSLDFVLGKISSFFFWISCWASQSVAMYDHHKVQHTLV